SYTSSFVVIAIKNGIKRTYTMFINDSGVPAYAQMAEEGTTEGNGVEVKVAVDDDFYSWKEEAKHVFSFFEIKPIITGDSSFIFREREIDTTLDLSKRF